MGIKKPPSAKSAASRFVERNSSPMMRKLTKESLQQLHQQDENAIKERTTPQKQKMQPQWAKNLHQIEPPNLRKKQGSPLEATFGKEVEGEEFTFGKKLKEYKGSARAPSLPPRSKEKNTLIRNKSTSAMKKSPSGKISVISESSEKQSQLSQQSRLSQLRNKYGNKRASASKGPERVKLRPLVPRPLDPLQNLMKRQMDAGVISVHTKADQKQEKRKSNLSRKPPLPQKSLVSETSEKVARQLNVHQFMLNELKRVNFEEAQLQRELVSLFVKSSVKENEVLTKNKIQIGEAKNSHQLYQKLLNKAPPKSYATEQEEEALMESITNLDNLLIQNKLKNEEELKRRVDEEKRKAKREQDLRKRELQKQQEEKAALERMRRENQKEKEALEKLRADLEEKQEQQLKAKRKQGEQVSIAAMVEAAKVPVANPMIETPYFNIAAPGGTNGGEGGEEEAEKKKEEEQLQKKEETAVGGSGKIIVNPHFNLAELLS